MEIELPDGTILEAPDGADPSVVAKAYLAKQKAPKRPNDPMNDPPLLPGSPGYDDPNIRPMHEAYDTFGKRAARYGRNVMEAASAVDRARTGVPALDLLRSADALGAVVRGTVATPVGAVVGAAKGESPEDEARIADEFVRRHSTPFTEGGRAQVRLVGALASPLSESGTDVALGPLAAEMNALRIPRAPKTTPDPIPTTQQLQKAKTAAYAVAKQADVTVPAEAYSRALGKVRSMATEEGIDPTLHPKSTAVMRRLEGAEGKPLSLQEAETLRKIALDAEDDLNPVTRAPTPDARIAGKIVDELDDHIEALELNSEARALNARFRRSDMIDRMIRRAEIRAGAHYTQAGMEHALRQEFKQLALSDRRMRFFTPEQRAAIEKVAKGGPIENSLRALGKFDPTSGGMAAFIGTGTGGAVGGALAGVAGGGLGALAVPALGFMGKRGATRMTGRNVNLAREALVGRGLPPTPEELGASIRGMASQQMQPISGEVMPRTPLALPAPNIIAGTRSAPGTAFARGEMGLTPDVERAGALHPGAARETLIPPSAPALPYRPAPGLLSDQRPMVVDSRGRVASIHEELQQYLRDTGQERLSNVRQPAVGSMPGGLLVDESASPAQGLLGSSTRSVGAIRQDLQKLDAKLRRLPADEPEDSPKVRAIAAELERLRTELSLAGSRGAAP